MPSKLLTAGIALAILACGAPPLRVQSSNGQVTFDIQTLGEYPTTVCKIRLAEGKTTVWEVVSIESTAQIRKVILHVGINSSSPPEVEHGSLRTVLPATGSGFVLQPGKTYKITFWGKGIVPSSATFQF